MTNKEIKTLKDLKEGHTEPYERACFDETKELAIKWVKADILNIREGMLAIDLLERWMERLNISEGDLE